MVQGGSSASRPRRLQLFCCVHLRGGADAAMLLTLVPAAAAAALAKRPDMSSRQADIISRSAQILIRQTEGENITSSHEVARGCLLLVRVRCRLEAASSLPSSAACTFLLFAGRQRANVVCFGSADSTLPTGWRAGRPAR